MFEFRRYSMALRAHAERLVWLGGVSLLALSCSSSDPNSLVTTCELPSDQLSTLEGHWATKPVPVALAAGQFSNDEANMIAAAADTWNNFYSSSESFKLIDYLDSNGNIRTSNTAKPSDICGQTLLDNGAFTSPVVIYKDGSWPYTSESQVIALTSFCPDQSTPLPNFNMAIMELNYQNFFVSGEPVPDLQSIVLHEFGHVAGLNHSCQPASTVSGMPDCDNADVNSAYPVAVMASVFYFNPSTNQGQQKRALTPNDEGRANCLYGTTPSQELNTTITPTTTTNGG